MKFPDVYYLGIAAMIIQPVVIAIFLLSKLVPLSELYMMIVATLTGTFLLSLGYVIVETNRRKNKKIIHDGVLDKQDKRKHTEELNKKIFKRLTTLTIREDRNGDYNLYVSKDEQYDDPIYHNILYTKSDERVLPLDKLPRPYFDWAFKHLEHKEYDDKMLKPFKKLEQLIEKYNQKEKKYRKTLEEKIDSVLSESFDCTIRVKTIRERLEQEFIQKPNHSFTDLIIDKISNHYGIMPKGYPIEAPYMICDTITNEQLEQFKDILNSILISDEFLTTNKTQMQILKEFEVIYKELKNNFKYLSDELEASGSIIEGNCKLSY